MSGLIYPLNNKEYTAEDVEIFNCTRTSGVYSVLDFDYTLSGYSITIGKGLAWIKNSDFSGKAIAFKKPEKLTFEEPHKSLERYDVVAIRFDADTQDAQLVIVKGEPSESPRLPPRSTFAWEYELFLYSILRKPSDYNISSDNITDLREDEAYCGIMRDSVTSGVAPLQEVIVENANLKQGDFIDFDANKYTHLVATVNTNMFSCDVVLSKMIDTFGIGRVGFTGMTSMHPLGESTHNTIFMGAQIEGKTTENKGHHIQQISFSYKPEFVGEDFSGIVSISKIVGVCERPEGYVKVDSLYNAESNNAQSGTAVAKAIEDAVKVASDNAKDLITESVDPHFIGDSERAQSGVAVSEALESKQDRLFAGWNIKTINHETLLGSGDVTIDFSEDIDKTNDKLKRLAESIDLNTLDGWVCRANVSTDGKWQNVNASVLSTYVSVVPTIPGEKLVISRNAFTKNTYFACLTDFKEPVEGESLMLSSDPVLGKVVKPTENEEYTIPSDTRFIVVSVNGTFNKATPSKFVLGGYDYLLSGRANVKAKQDVLVSGESIKTINGESILGSGDIDVGGATEKVYTPDDFRNDYRSIGTGWTVSNVAISNADLLKVRSGDKISITVPTGFRVDIKLISSEDFAEPSAISLTEDAKSNITESLNHTFINSGYLDIMVRKPVSSGFTSISPSDYACDIKVETKGILDRMDDAEKRLGEVDNLLEEIGGNVEKNKTSIDTLTKQVLEVIPEKTYTSADFIQGWRQLGVGFENVTTYITNAELLKVEAGDKITINPNGYKLWVSVADTDDYSVSGKTYSLNEPNVTEYFEHTFEKNGYLNINVNNFGHRINPSDYTCDITVVLDDTKHRLTEIENNSKSAEILSPKSRPFTTIVDDCQDASKWTITNKSASAVDTDCIMWNQSLHCDGRMRCTQTTYDLLNNDIVIKIRINSIPYGEEYKGNGIYMRLSNTSTPSIGAKYCLMQGAETTPLGAWREITIPYTGYINKDKPELDFSAINDIDIFADQGSTDTNYDGTADWNIQYIGIRPRKLNKGIVSFTFDDGYKSQYTGVKLLAEKGISSTIYHIAEATGQSTEILSIEELQELVNYYGADIEVHGDIPENESGENGYNALSDEELIKHWTDSQRFLKENGLSSGRHMSYPGNYHSNRVVQLAKRFFDSCRTIQYYIPCESYPPADHYRLRAVSSVSAALNDVDTIKRYIDRAMESGSWLILTFHRIGDVQGDSMYCSESDLQAIADYAIKSGAIIKNIAEVYDTTSISCNFEDRIVPAEGFEGNENQTSNAFVPSMALFYDLFSGLEKRINDLEKNL